MAGKTILVVDDSRVQRMIIESTLVPFGFEVVHAENGKHALELLENMVPDLILLDLEMPVMDGFETLEHIRKNKAYEDIPILFLTIVDKKSKIIKGLDAGADDYITKPYNRQELISRVNAVLRRKERFKRLKGDIQGDLSNMTLADFMESIETNSKTAKIKIPDIDAELFFEYGNLIHVRQKDQTGNPALSRIFLHNKGQFMIRFNQLPGDIPNEPMSIYKALRNVLSILEFDEDDYIRKHPNRARVIQQVRNALRRSELKTGVDGIMNGFLEDVDIESLMQGIEHSSKTASIRFEDIDGDIYFQNGDLFHVRLGNFTGDRALRRIFLLNRGAFTVRYGVLPDMIPGSPRPLLSVLMNTITTVDEVREMLEEIGNEKTIVDFDIDLPEFEEIKSLKILPPVGLMNLIVLMNGDLKENLQFVMSAMENGKMKILPSTN